MDSLWDEFGMEAGLLLTARLAVGWLGKCTPAESKTDRTGLGIVTPANARPANSRGRAATRTATLAIGARRQGPP